jgi:DNA-binding NtrC family response regulator
VATDDDPHETPAAATQSIGGDEAAPAVLRFQLSVVDGPRRGLASESISDRCSIGSNAGNDLVIDEPTVSRFHCEVLVDKRGARVRDLESKNGTLLDGNPVVEAFLRGGSLLRLGRSVVRFQFATERNRLLVSERGEFGSLVGTSVAMRSTFALLERAAGSDATVLLEGETGTGKEGAAASLHRLGARRDGPFVVVDCSAIPENLLESELFGHEKGAFTGAAARRVGAFEEASGGTIFLDEIGELPPDLQPKLLRVLEQREVRRIGSNTALPIDVRVVAATNRDLRTEVNATRFRADLYFRLAVVRIPLPPLRARLEDLPLLVERILASLRATPEAAAPLRTPEFIAQLGRAAWPSNVRELRNYLERSLVFAEPAPLDTAAEAPACGVEIDTSLPYEESRRRAIDEFERRWVKAILHAHQGHVSRAAGAAGIDRAYLHRLMRRHGIKS